MKSAVITEIIEENLKTIFAYALSRVSNKEDAEDLTNDIVAALLASADKIRNEDAFYGYVWAVAANTYRKFIRNRKRHTSEEIDENIRENEDFTEELARRDDYMVLRREISLLSREYRKCTVAYYFDGLSCSEVAKKFGISLEMVKYYLFKTRKILKEGISMEREFGEKSFRPAPFEFVTIFSGRFNGEYKNLFTRKLPGQILMSAYYTPMTIRELAIELGVASVYLEDEVGMLEKYNLIKPLSGGKYQTNLVIFTEEYTNEFYKTAEKFAIPEMGKILACVKEKIDGIRAIIPRGDKLSESRIMWSLVWPLMRRGIDCFGDYEENTRYSDKDVLYGDSVGVNYGIAYESNDGEYECHAFAGGMMADDHYHGSAADFGILPKNNRYFDIPDKEPFIQRIYKNISGEIAPDLVIITADEESRLYDLLGDEIEMMAELYKKLFECGCRLMRTHAPKGVENQIESKLFHTLLFRTVGFVGGCAVKSGELNLPDFDGPAAIWILEK